MTELYKNISSLKKTDVPYSYTEKDIKEYTRCMNDIYYFAEHYVKVISLDRGLEIIKLRPYQKRLIAHLIKNKNIVCLSSRQSGKCISFDTNITIKQDGKIKFIKIGELFNKTLHGQLENQEDRHKVV